KLSRLQITGQRSCGQLAESFCIRNEVGVDTPDGVGVSPDSDISQPCGTCSTKVFSYRRLNVRVVASVGIRKKGHRLSRLVLALTFRLNDLFLGAPQRYAG